MAEASAEWVYDLRSHQFLFEPLGLEVSAEGFDDWVEAAVEERVELMERQPDAVIGEAVLGKVVGANLLATLASADHRVALLGDGLALLLLLHLEQAAAQHLQGPLPVLDLRLLVLAGNDQARRQMSDAHGGVGSVDRLAAGTRLAERVHADFLGVNDNVHLVGFR